ncbi:hypothetical protein, partial [Salmonella enterica]|uniref:hypothetical protein n=1 Tax=Salmonella enterica TaxID=28901 RepID=UPI0020C5AA83
SKTVESGLVNYMDIGHNQSSEHHWKTVHRQTCFRIDTQILGEDLHKIHNSYVGYMKIGRAVVGNWKSLRGC